MGNEIAAVAYGMLAGCCLAAAYSEGRLRRSRGMAAYPSLWVMLAVLLLLLSWHRVTGELNNVTNYFRLQARMEGWYAERRDLQWSLIRAVPFLGIVLCGGFAWWVRRAGRRLILPALALVYLLCFTLVQVVSLHQMDWMMGRRVGPLSVQGWCYVVGFALSVGALAVGMVRRSVVIVLPAGERVPRPEPRRQNAR
ncbi:MAG TPA: hypothetical protein VM490_15420 [Armatimonadaceae bacterium]|nr:hypothetical protein [Armatimonadaceae bacterium]